MKIPSIFKSAGEQLGGWVREIQTKQLRKRLAEESAKRAGKRIVREGLLNRARAWAVSRGLAGAGMATIGGAVVVGGTAYILYERHQRDTAVHEADIAESRWTQTKADLTAAHADAKREKQAKQAAAARGANLFYAVEVRVGSKRILTVRKSDGDGNLAIVRSSLRHGGRGGDLATVVSKDGPFYNALDATRALANKIPDGSMYDPPLAAGWVARIGGSSVTIDDWGLVDHSELGRLGKRRT